MIDLCIEAGRLVSQSIAEVKSRRESASMTEMLIREGIVGSDSSLSWIRKGQTKDILRYAQVIYEVTKFLPPDRRDYYRLEMFEIMVRTK